MKPLYALQMASGIVMLLAWIRNQDMGFLILAMAFVILTIGNTLMEIKDE